MFFLFSDFSFLKASRRWIKAGFEGRTPVLKKTEIREWEPQNLNRIDIKESSPDKSMKNALRRST